jgi:hypothetical protein
MIKGGQNESSVRSGPHIQFAARFPGTVFGHSKQDGAKPSQCALAVAGRSLWISEDPVSWKCDLTSIVNVISEEGTATRANTI